MNSYYTSNEVERKKTYQLSSFVTWGKSVRRLAVIGWSAYNCLSHVVTR